VELVAVGNRIYRWVGTAAGKIREYLDSGLRLGWLIHPQDSQVEIYRPNQPVEIVSFPVQLSGEEVLPRFVLDLPLG
jgi:Uma2 family endonuclease